MKYENELSETVAKIIESTCPNINKLLVTIEGKLSSYEKIEMIYWTESYFHIWVNDSRYSNTVEAMRMGFSVDYKNDIILYEQPYTKQKGFYIRSHKWSRFLRENNIPYDQYCINLKNKPNIVLTQKNKQ